MNTVWTAFENAATARLLEIGSLLYQHNTKQEIEGEPAYKKKLEESLSYFKKFLTSDKNPIDFYEPLTPDSLHWTPDEKVQIDAARFPGLKQLMDSDAPYQSVPTNGFEEEIQNATRKFQFILRSINSLM